MITKKDIKKLTQHERVVLFRALRMGLTLAEYDLKYHVKNVPNLLKG